MKRSYPERLVPSKLSLSCEYMGRESSRWGRGVEDWVVAYLRRNDIPWQEEVIDDERRLRIDFQSRWRQKFFILRANAEFPYFEFA